MGLRFYKAFEDFFNIKKKSIKRKNSRLKPIKNQLEIEQQEKEKIQLIDEIGKRGAAIHGIQSQPLNAPCKIC